MARDRSLTVWRRADAAPGRLHPDRACRRHIAATWAIPQTGPREIESPFGVPKRQAAPASSQGTRGRSAPTPHPVFGRGTRHRCHGMRSTVRTDRELEYFLEWQKRGLAAIFVPIARTTVDRTILPQPGFAHRGTASNAQRRKACSRKPYKRQPCTNTPRKHSVQMPSYPTIQQQQPKTNHFVCEFGCGRSFTQVVNNALSTEYVICAHDHRVTVRAAGGVIWCMVLNPSRSN